MTYGGVSIPSTPCDVTREGVFFFKSTTLDCLCILHYVGDSANLSPSPSLFRCRRLATVHFLCVLSLLKIQPLSFICVFSLKTHKGYAIWPCALALKTSHVHLWFHGAECASWIPYWFEPPSNCAVTNRVAWLNHALVVIVYTTYCSVRSACKYDNCK
jgi:hypothetical protein